MKKIKSSKAETMKRLSPKSNVTVLPILECLQFKKFTCLPTRVAGNTFQGIMALHFEIHFTPVSLNLKLSQVLYFILHQVINTTLRRVTREEKGGGLPSPFSKFKKIALILEKKKT